MKYLYFSLFLFSCYCFNAQSQTQWVPQKASVSFSIKNAGLNVKGTFKGLQASISFDENTLQQSSIIATVDAGTIDTDIELRNKHLKKEEYFNTEKYPKITLKSKNFARTPDGNYNGTFILTLKNTSKEINITFDYDPQGEQAVFKGNFKIDRLDFGIGDKSWTMSNEVSVSLWLSAIKNK